MQCDCVVEGFVLSSINKRDVMPGEECADFIQGVGVAVEFLVVSALEFFPAFGVMVEPLAELKAWRGILGPCVEVGVITGDGAGPEAIDEDAYAVLLGGGFVDTFDFEGRAFACGFHGFALLLEEEGKIERMDRTHGNFKGALSAQAADECVFMGVQGCLATGLAYGLSDVGKALHA